MSTNHTAAAAITLREALDDAHEHHADEPLRLADALQTWAPRLAADDEAAEALQLAEHVCIGHLGDGAALQALLSSVPVAVFAHDGAALQQQRSRWVLAVLAGAPVDVVPPPVLRWRGLQNLWLAQALRGQAEAAREAVVQVQAEAAASDDVPAVRALAATANNLAQHLRLGLPMNAPRRALMLAAAHASAALWARVGTWLHAERAEYELALCQAAAGDADAALAHARRCLAICEAEGADAVERFFAHEALAEACRAGHRPAEAGAHRQHMAALLSEVEDPSMRAFCTQALAAATKKAG